MHRWNVGQEIMCIKNCGRPAVYKKVSLCAHCYSKNKYTPRGHKRNLESRHIYLNSSERKYEHKAEVLFGQSHPSFIYEPAIFRLENTKYTPDFYDPDENVFYEIIGSRQRFEQLKPKIRKFQELFPNIKIEVVCGDGNPYHSLSSPELVTRDRVQVFPSNPFKDRERELDQVLVACMETQK